MTDQIAYQPVRRSEARAARSNPEGTVVPVEALRTVVLFTLADAFALVPEETMWADHRLADILAPLTAFEASSVPLAVRQEMLEGNYRHALEAIGRRNPHTSTPVWDKEAVKATAEDWAGVTMQMVTECYTLRPLDESAMHAKLLGLLRDLGLDHPYNPRPARYLPNDVRYRLNRKTG